MIDCSAAGATEAQPVPELIDALAADRTDRARAGQRPEPARAGPGRDAIRADLRGAEAQRLRRDGRASSPSTTSPTARAPPRSPPATCAAFASRSPSRITLRNHIHGDTTTRTHHARRHRPDGDEPAPDPLDLRDPRPGRRRARERRQGDARPDPDRPQRRARSRRSRRRTASPAGAPTSTPRSPNKDDTIFFDAGTTQMRPMLLAKALARRQARLLREADRDQPQRGGRDRDAWRRRPG